MSALVQKLRRRTRRLESLRSDSRLRPPPLPLLNWTAHYLSDVQTCAPSAFHIWLCNTLDELTPSARLVIQAPRGAAKSSYASLAFPLREALEGREPFTVICSDTAEQAKDFLRQIRREVEGNERLRNAYRNCRPGKVWRENRISIPHPDDPRRECEIAALGTGGKIRGRKSAANRRPSLVLVDDPQNKDHIQSALRRSRSLEWLRKDVLSAGEPGTRFVVVGTALHRDAIVCDLERAAGWRSRTWRSIIRWPDRMDLWREWEALLFSYDVDDAERAARARAFYDANRKEMDKGAEVLWEARESLYDLMLKRASDGHAAFESEKQNSPVDPSACEWPEEYLNHPNMWFDEWPDKLVVRTMSLDPSKGKSAKQGDYSAIVKFGRDRFGVEYIEADLARRPVNVQCHELARQCHEFRPDGVAIEINQFQELMVVPIQQAAALLQIELPIYTVDNTVAKEVRIRRLTTPLAQQKTRFKTRSPGTQLLLQQARDWPGGTHDDGIDAWEGARRLAIDLTGGRVVKRR